MCVCVLRKHARPREGRTLNSAAGIAIAQIAPSLQTRIPRVLEREHFGWLAAATADVLSCETPINPSARVRRACVRAYSVRKRSVGQWADSRTIGLHIA